MPLIAAQQVSLSGLEATYTAAAASQTFVPGNNVILHVINGGASPITATIVTTSTVAGQAVADVAVTVTNAEERFIGPFQRQYFSDANGQVAVNWSATTSVSFAVLRI